MGKPMSMSASNRIKWCWRSRYWCRCGCIVGGDVLINLGRRFLRMPTSTNVEFKLKQASAHCPNGITLPLLACCVRAHRRHICCHHFPTASPPLRCIHHRFAASATTLPYHHRFPTTAASPPSAASTTASPPSAASTTASPPMLVTDQK
jgi:hypothetical protein